MVQVLELPTNFQDTTALADWLELKALTSGDKNASAGDLQNALQIAIGSNVAEERAINVIFEIEERIGDAAKAYPFELHKGRALQAKSKVENYTAYIFCLYLSYFGWKPRKGEEINPRLLFEELSCVAARQYLQGDVFRFGTSRRKSGVASFSQAVNELCNLLGEGTGIRPVKTLNKKDDHVDLVAWRSFKDQRESKLIIFGQCATGDNWTEKLSELQPDIFWSHWMQESQVSPLCRSLFIPHRISYEDGEQWRYYSRYGGILFDRCRLAYWAWTDNRLIQKDSRYLYWCNLVFPFRGE